MQITITQITPVLIQDLGMMYPTESSSRKYQFAIFTCECGNNFKSMVRNVNMGKTKSCGCRIAKVNSTHKLSKHRLYNTWNKMISRCTSKSNKNYKDYGERGITVCDRWMDLNNFIDDMYPTYKEGLSIDRINNDGNYEPSNCRWTTKNVQSRNTRKISKNNTSGYRGVHFHQNKWCSSIRINYKRKQLGYYHTSLEAAKAYDTYVTLHNLEHTKNFS